VKAFVIGNENAILGFSLVGVDGRVVRNSAELEAALDRCLADKTIALVLMTSDVIPFARDRVERLQVGSVSPLVVEIPGEHGRETTADSLKEFVQRAVGVHLEGA
jgi:V/A-type H+-transporting ATPase subunit F